jgi:hypothetical protein
MKILLTKTNPTTQIPHQNNKPFSDLTGFKNLLGLVKVTN